MLVGYIAPSGATGPGDGAHADAEAALGAAGCEKIFREDAAGRRGERTALKAAIDFLRAGDVLMVMQLQDIATDVESVVAMVDRLRRTGVAVRIGADVVVPGTPVGDAFQIACRELARLLEPSDALPLAGAGGGRRRGRPQALSSKDLAKARRLLAESTMTVSDVARALGVSPATVYRYFPRRAPKAVMPKDAAP